MPCGCAYSTWLHDGHRHDCPERAAWLALRPIGTPYPFPPVSRA